MRPPHPRLVLAPLLLLALGAAPAAARGQGWDYGRQMFGFAERAPGGVWTSYYHPDFDPDAWYPAILGDLAHPRRPYGPFAGRQGVVTYPPTGGVIVRSSPGIFNDPPRPGRSAPGLFFRRQRGHGHPMTPGYPPGTP